MAIDVAGALISYGAQTTKSLANIWDAIKITKNLTSPIAVKNV